MKIIFGPISSRRFGISLGIDLSPNEKSCNFDCLYCELPHAKRRSTIAQEPSVGQIISDIEKATYKHPSIDYLTITANGEPTLYSKLPDLIKTIKERFSQKLLILSNASRLVSPEIFNALLLCDEVKLSLDCATQKTFLRLDRPKDVDLDALIESIKNFSHAFTKTLRLEVLIVKGLNDTKEELLAINEAIKDMRLECVEVGTIERPSAYNVKAIDEHSLRDLASLITSQRVKPIFKQNTSSTSSYTKDELLKTISMRSISSKEAKLIFDKPSMDRLNELIKDEKVLIVQKENDFFYTHK